jgi:Zn-finger nucleic acid-binding protein
MPTPPVTPSDSAGALHCPNCGAAVSPDAASCQYCQASLATMKCPSCFGRLFLGAAFCPACGARASRAATDVTPPKHCPACRGVMQAAQVGPLALADCATCAGVWVDAATFEALRASIEAQAAVLHETAAGRGAPVTAVAGARIRYRPCPRCGQMMNRVNFAKYSGVILDVCRDHGSFFDRDELQRVVRFIQAGGLDRAREKDRLALAEEERRIKALSHSPAAGVPLTLGDDAASRVGWDLTEGVLSQLLHWLLDRR